MACQVAHGQPKELLTELPRRPIKDVLAEPGPVAGALLQTSKEGGLDQTIVSQNPLSPEKIKGVETII